MEDEEEGTGSRKSSNKLTGALGLLDCICVIGEETGAIVG